MKTISVHLKVFKISLATVLPVVLLLCFVCQWPLKETILAMMYSVLISVSALVSLPVLIWFFRSSCYSRSFVWMLLLSSIPVTSFSAAWLFADFVPGKTGFVLLLGMVAAYAALFVNGIAISQFFNSTYYEREESPGIN